MKTVAFSEILAEMCQLIGLDRNTLNDKSFNAVRDFVNRRLSMIWDREEWPDIQELVRIWPGVPITNVVSYPVSITTEVPTDLLQENNLEILFQNAENTVPMTITLDVTVPRIYLKDFADEAWQKGTISNTEVAFVNPFYVLQDGELVSIAKTQYKFAYSTATDNYGEYITSVTINAPDGVPQWTSMSGTTLQFTKNSQPMAVVRGQAIGCWSDNPNRTTRKVDESYTVENMPNILQASQYLSQELNVLRFSNFNEKWVLLRTVAPFLFGTRYDNTLVYSPGSQVYYDPSQASSAYNPPSKNKPVAGNFWNTIATAAANVLPANPSAFWSMAQIPFRFKGYVVNAASADFLRSEGRAAEADSLEAMAEFSVQQQIDVLIRQQGQIQRMNMVYTY
jgi:hypothetical protein